MLRAMLDETGFEDSYDFVNVSHTQTHTRNRHCCAWINFTDTDSAWKFKLQFNHCKLVKDLSHKTLTVIPALVQGLDANCALDKHKPGDGYDPSPIWTRRPAGSGLKKRVVSRTG